jgi:hypothetical protein
MRISYSGSNGLLFPPSPQNTTRLQQNSAGLTASGWNSTAKPVRLNGLKVETGVSGTFGSALSAKNIQQWDGYWAQAQNTSVNIMYNAGSYEDVNFILTLISYHSSISYQMWTGTFGGYGSSWATYGSGAFSLSTAGTGTAGFSYLRLSVGGLTGGVGNTYAQMIILGDQPVVALLGGMY